MKLRCYRAIAALLLLICGQSALRAEALPSDSLYQLDVTLTDQRGTRQAFAAGGGQVRIVTLFYATCGYVCPLTIDTLQRIEAELSPAERTRLAVLLITFDPERDSVAALRALAQARKADPARWRLARTDTAAEVRKLAALLGVQYRRLSNGEYNHTTVLTLLDAQGRVLARSDKLGMLDRAFVARLREALGSETGTAAPRRAGSLE